VYGVITRPKNGAVLWEIPTSIVKSEGFLDIAIRRFLVRPKGWKHIDLREGVVIPGWTGNASRWDHTGLLVYILPGEEEEVYDSWGDSTKPKKGQKGKAHTGDILTIINSTDGAKFAQEHDHILFYSWGQVLNLVIDGEKEDSESDEL
jgi:hypothetical protein